MKEAVTSWLLTRHRILKSKDRSLGAEVGQMPMLTTWEVWWAPSPFKLRCT